MKIGRALSCSLGALAVSACAITTAPSTAGMSGDLGNGVFSYECLDASDAACVSGNTLPGCEGHTVYVPAGGSAASGASTKCFPPQIAEGSRFAIHFTPRSGLNAGNPIVRPSTPYFIQANGDTSFRTVRTGYAGLYATNTVDGEVLDFFLARIVKVASLRVVDAESKPVPTPLAVKVGSRTALKVRAIGTNTEATAGALDFEWSTASDATARLKTGNPTATMDLEGVAVGMATLTVKVGEVTSNIEVRVEN